MCGHTVVPPTLASERTWASRPGGTEGPGGKRNQVNDSFVVHHFVHR